MKCQGLVSRKNIKNIRLCWHNMLNVHFLKLAFHLYFGGNMRYLFFLLV